MSAQPRLVISAKNLGALALPGFCPRCFWLGEHYDLPFGGPFPGIFSSLDSFSKKVVHASFDQGRGAPPWLAPVGRAKSYIPPPGPRSFYWDDPATGVRLTGAPDGILVLEDGTRAIIDYKTAKHTRTQDALFPMYEVQLNGYAAIADWVGLGPVSRLALVYTEPVTDEPPDALLDAGTGAGFRLGFRAKVVDVSLKPAMLPPLMKRARQISQRPTPPPGATMCSDCSDFSALLSASRGWP